jgi:hypothetical protein
MIGTDENKYLNLAQASVDWTHRSLRRLQPFSQHHNAIEQRTSRTYEVINA